MEIIGTAILIGTKVLAKFGTESVDLIRVNAETWIMQGNVIVKPDIAEKFEKAYQKYKVAK